MATKKTETKTTKKAETKKAAPKKAEKKAEPKKEVKKDTRVWRTGQPIKSGIYAVKLDGKETKLQFIMGFRKGKWATLDGQLALGSVEEWTEAE